MYFCAVASAIGGIVFHAAPKDMPEHIEEINLGPPTTPRPAASVILLRRGGKHASRGLEVLLVKRTAAARFMANVWVFPGGAVDAAATSDVGEEEAHRVTALRELEEEASVRLSDPDELVPFSRWITPVEVKVRFDTRFYLALAPAHCAPEPDGEEVVDAGWYAPGDALERGSAGQLLLVFPTIKQLEALLEFRSTDEALETARAMEVQPILPKVVTKDGEPRVLLPGEPGYD
jgi:8-oxo-dGTP pyrophosphatase MutT (NUDIX family)